MSEKKKIELFEHELVPKHTRLSQNEAHEVLAKYQIFPYQLPHIKSSDPAIRELKAAPGDIIKIIRKSQTMGTAITYRCVIEG